LGLYHQTILPTTSDITSYQRKSPDSFPSNSLFELLRLNSSALPQLKHDTTKDLIQLPSIHRSAPDTLKEKRALLTERLLLSFPPEVRLDLVGQHETFCHFTVVRGPNYINLISPCQWPADQ